MALVTGASRGLGAVIARVLAERGYDLVIGAREREAAATGAPTELSDAACGSCRWPGDITDAATRARLVDAARTLGGLDVLVNNASELGGIGPLHGLRRARVSGASFRVNTGRADRAHSARGAAARRTPRPHREHHERRGAGRLSRAGDRTAPARRRSSS